MLSRQWLFLLGLCASGCGLVLNLDDDGDGGSGPLDAGAADTTAPPDGPDGVDGSADAGLSPRIGAASRIPRMDGGDDYFLFGANLPWRTFGEDFGGASGVRTEVALAELREVMTHAGATGFRALRWVAVATPLDDTSSAPAARDDIRAALDLAQELELYLELVVVLHLALPADAWDSADAREPTLSWVRDLAATAEVHAPGRIFTWTISAHYSELDPDVVSPEGFAATVQDFVHGIRAAAPSAWVTGHAEGFAAGATLCSLGADIVGITELGPGTPSSCAICSTYADVTAEHAALRCPLVVSLFYDNGPGITGDTYQSYLDSGYAGAVPHSLLPERTADGMAIDETLAAEFASRNAAVLGP